MITLLLAASDHFTWPDAIGFLGFCALMAVMVWVFFR